jgi:hypothetical protein
MFEFVLMAKLIGRYWAWNCDRAIADQRSSFNRCCFHFQRSCLKANHYSIKILIVFLDKIPDMCVSFIVTLILYYFVRKTKKREKLLYVVEKKNFDTKLNEFNSARFVFSFEANELIISLVFFYVRVNIVLGRLYFFSFSKNVPKDNKEMPWNDEIVFLLIQTWKFKFF